MEEPEVSAPEPPDVDALIAQLRARVEERRRSGLYPPGFEEGLAEIYSSILARKGRRAPDLSEALGAVAGSLSFDPARIPSTSERPGGEMVHRTVARVVGRQVHGVLEQVRDFALPVSRALEEIVEAFVALHTEVMDRLAAVYERQAIQERAIVQGAAWPGGPALLPQPLQAWWSAERLEDTCRGPRPQVVARWEDVARRLVGRDPVLDLACGRGELLEVLGGLDVSASGVDRDPALVAVASRHGLEAESGAPLASLGRAADAGLGAVVMWRGVERMAAGELSQLVALAGAKVRPGGVVLVEAVDPTRPGAWAHPALTDPAAIGLVPAGRLRFLCQEAGFSTVDVETRPGPGDGGGAGGAAAGEWGTYLVTATR